MPKVKAKKEIKEVIEKRDELTPMELQELIELQRAEAQEKFKAKQVLGNTALIPNGKEYGKQLEAMGTLIENVKNNWVSGKLSEMGFKQNELVSLNLATGKVIIQSDTKKK